jgi:hypothetical protein
LAIAGGAAVMLVASYAEAAAALPDGRVYEQVSPIQKNGSQAGIRISNSTDAPGYSVTTLGGNAAVFAQSGPFAETASGYEEYSVAGRGPNGWQTRAALPPGYGANATNVLGERINSLVPSADLSRFAFSAFGSFAAEDTNLSGLYAPERSSQCSGSHGLECEGGLFRGGAAQLSEAEAWVSAPVLPNGQDPEKPNPRPGNIPNDPIEIAGGAPDLSTIYFDYYGTLVPEDASRAPQVTINEGSPTGFYEWHEPSGLRSAGELPNGSYSPYGAVAANNLSRGGEPEAVTAGSFGNQVSSNASTALFVSPEPRFASAAQEPVELYAREQAPGGPHSVLVSRDSLLPPLAGGEPAPAPGAGSETAVTPVGGSYAYGAPDGSRVFFQSTDTLAKSADGEEPAGPGPWMYEFDLANETLTYLPGAAGRLIAASQDGSSFLFAKVEDREVFIESEEETQTWRLPVALDLWTEGQVHEVAALPVPSEVERGEELEALAAQQFGARATSGGTTFVFETKAALTSALAPSGFNNSHQHSQVYRYLAPTGASPAGALSCLSCPSAPTAPSGDASLSVDEGFGHTQNSRAISVDGDRVFFATPEALVTADVNGHVTDVYEWEQAGTGVCAAGTTGGCRFLISSGTSGSPSWYLDSDETGQNVFFTTRQGLVAGDQDESYDVYDARIGGGFPHEASISPCMGDCRPPGVAPPIESSVTASIGPSGNLSAPPPPTSSPHKPLTKAQRLALALKTCKHRPKRKRAKCVAAAHRRYGTTTARTKASHRHTNHRRGK